MGRTLFGTDGVRGRANTYPMNSEAVMRLSMAAGQYFKSGSHSHRVVIGKDTRRSGYMLETAMVAGFAAVGMSSLMLGPVPTPAVGMLTRSMRADLGVMISASHNAFHDNGIKFFGPDGYKLSDEAEAEIEALFGQDPVYASDTGIGTSTRINDALGRYAEFVKTTLPRGLRLDGLKVVIDCANGAAYKVAPQVLWELGAEVIPIGTNPNGFNINKGCGSTDTTAAQQAVVTFSAHVGITLDGDADRLIVIDETGTVADGDQIMGLIAGRWKAAGRLTGDTLVTTVMSNLGLERHLDTLGISLARTKVGDRYVVEEMRSGGYALGGEQSGHIVMRDYVTTGDGLLAAVQVLASLVEEGRKASEVLQVFTPVPQRLVNVRFESGGDPLAATEVKAAITAGEARFGDRGRLVIRKSGTEPLLRIMGECTDEATLNAVLEDIADAVRSALS
ncbi:MAG: phosphoglucosamine mutase [Pseudomonadota bacterium]